MIQLLPGIRIKVPNKHSTYGRVKVKTIQLISGNVFMIYSCFTIANLNETLCFCP